MRNGTPAEVALVKEDQLVGKTYDEVVARFAGKVAHEEIITLEPNDFGVREGLYDRLAATAKGNRFKEMQIELEEHVHVMWLHRDADATWKVFADVEYHKSVEF